VKALLISPILVPLATAALLLLCPRWPRLRQGLSIVGAGLLLAAGAALLVGVRREGIQVLHLGSWPAPHGITFVADLLSAVLVVLAGVLGLTVSVYAVSAVDARRKAFGFESLVHLLLMGVCGAFLTGDLFNLYVWFEVLLISSFILLALGGEPLQLEGALKYVVLNLLASALFLAAVGLLYGMAGTLNMADLALKLRQVDRPGLVLTVAMLLLAAFGIKAALFPLFFWLPASYHTPPVAVAALFSGLLTKVGIYSVIRTFTLIFTMEAAYSQSLFRVIAGLTMITGVLGAASQFDFRRILAFHSISQIGYILMGLGLFTTHSLAGALFFIVHHSLVKSGLFLVSGVVNHQRGTFGLKELGGIYPRHGVLSALFALLALSLAGLPPLSGFFAKLALVRSGLRLEHYALVATALIVGVLTLFSMTKIWAEAFWKPAPAAEPPQEAVPSPPWSMMLPLAGVAALVLCLGLLPGPAFTLATEAAEQLLNPEDYLRTLLGEGR